MEYYLLGKSTKSGVFDVDCLLAAALSLLMQVGCGTWCIRDTMCRVHDVVTALIEKETHRQANSITAQLGLWAKCVIQKSEQDTTARFWGQRSMLCVDRQI